MNKKILIVSGIAGCGMSSFSSEILRRIDFNLKYPVTTTSRGKRGDEKDGVHYHFISPVEFREKIENDEFIEFENVYGSVFYGTEEKELSVDGHNIILVTSLETALKIKKRYGQDCLTIFIRPSHLSDLSEWLFRENIYTGEKIEELVAKAKKEVKLTPKFDVICEKNRKNEIANYDQVLLKIANFLFCGSIIIDSSISGIDMIGYVISSLDNEYRKGTNPNYIFRGVTAFYGDSNTDDFTHVIKSGHQVRMDVSGSRDHKKSVIYLRTLLNAARRQFPKTYTGSDLEILSDIQHYGGATCLIDFSQNILTALWFACQGDFNQTGYLYCYNISEELKK